MMEVDEKGKEGSLAFLDLPKAAKQKT